MRIVSLFFLSFSFLRRFFLFTREDLSRGVFKSMLSPCFYI